MLKPHAKVAVGAVRKRLLSVLIGARAQAKNKTPTQGVLVYMQSWIMVNDYRRLLTCGDNADFHI